MKATFNERISDIKVALNRLRTQKSAILHKVNARKSRTRTLIQLGGLINLTPLVSICDITLGEDLQTDFPDKAATILGILTYFSNQLPLDINQDMLDTFKTMGVNLMKRK